MRVGLACRWDRPREGTWSQIPWNLGLALDQVCDLVQLPAQLPRPARAPVEAVALARYGDRASARYLRIGDYFAAAALRLQADRLRPDAIIEIGDIAATSRPFFIYQDLSYELLERHRRILGERVLGVAPLPPAELRRRKERQARLHEAAAGVFTMSRWLADDLVRSGVSAARVHPVFAGRTSIPSTRQGDGPWQRDSRTRLLFVGRDFLRKGGDLVLGAFERLHAADPALSLTVAGPSAWPMTTRVPAGVSFLGTVTAAEAGRLFRQHDLLVMPSRFEAFGIVFVEALAEGVPCIGRNTCAMPEIISPGVNGELVDGEDPDELSAAITTALANDELYRNCESRREEVAQFFSWTAVADRMLAAVRARLYGSAH